MLHTTPDALPIKEMLRQIPSLKAPLPDLDLSAMPATPQEAFALWLDAALAAGVREPHAMTLSTVDEQGWPDARVLILKNVDARGWHFAVKRESPKVRQIEHQPKVSLTFYWPALGRQIRLRGEAGALSAQECAEDFLGRPVGSRASAMASRQSEIMEDPQSLARRLAEVQAFLEDHPGHVEPGWQVYAVAPTVVEFWQGATDRNHKRWRYTATSEGGRLERDPVVAMMGAWPMDGLVLRRASEADAPALLGLFDEVIAWFREMGNPGQWGTEPWSTQPRRIERVTEACALPGAWVVQTPAGALRAALVLGEAMPYVPPATEAEIYVRLLVASRDPAARGVGKHLMAFADEQARMAGVGRLRVDCYAGGSGALVRFYESCGYARVSTFEVEGWPGQLLARSL